MKNLMLSVICLATLITGCNKEEESHENVSEKPFKEAISGKWYVAQVMCKEIMHRYCSQTSFESWNAGECQIYSIYDNKFCTLPYIDNLEHWNINQKEDGLFLESEDLCGYSGAYYLIYRDIQCITYTDEGILINLYEGDLVLKNHTGKDMNGSFRLWTNEDTITNEHHESLEIVLRKQEFVTSQIEMIVLRPGVVPWHH